MRKFNNSIIIEELEDYILIGDTVSGNICGVEYEYKYIIEDLKIGKRFNLFNTTHKERKLINQFEELGFFSKPNLERMAYIHVTHKCNLDCKSCYSAISNRNVAENIDINKYYKAIDLLYKLNTKVFVISGGEPLLSKDLMKILERIKEKDSSSKIILISNGTMPVERYYNVLPLIDQLSFSIDGFSDDVNFIRPKGIHNKIIENANQLKNKIEMTFIVTLHHGNIDNIDDYAVLSNNLNIPISFSLYMSNIGDDFHLTEDDFDKLYQRGKELKELVSNKIDVSLGCKDSCGMGKTIISVDAFGDVYPCHMLHNKKYKITDLDDANAYEKILNYKNVFVKNINGCGNCKHKFICGGGCRARALIYDYNILGRDPACKLYKLDIESELGYAK